MRVCQISDVRVRRILCCDYVCLGDSQSILDSQRVEASSKSDLRFKVCQPKIHRRRNRRASQHRRHVELQV